LKLFRTSAPAVCLKRFYERSGLLRRQNEFIRLIPFGFDSRVLS